MHKLTLIFITILILFISGCGQVAKSVSTAPALTKISDTDRPLTAEEITLSKLTIAIKDLAASMAAPETGEPVEKQSSGMSAQSLANGNNVQTKIFSRQVGSNKETVEIKSVYYWKGNEISETFIEGKTQIDRVERTVAVDCAAYSYNYPEDISYNPPTITQKAGYISLMRHKQQNLDAEVLSRKIIYTDLNNGGNATGTMTIRSGSLDGILYITITNGYFFAEGNLKINGKIAAYVKIENSDVTIQYLFGPSDDFYYNNNNLPPAVNGEIVIYLLNDVEYNDIKVVMPNNNNKLVIIGEEGAVVNGQIEVNNNKTTITINGVIFKVPADKTSIAIPNAVQKNILTIENCTFLQIDNGAPNPGLLSLDIPNGNGAAIIIKNCNFIGKSLKNAVGLYIKNGNTMTLGNLTLSNCNFSHLDYGIYVNGHKQNNQVDASGLNMEDVNNRINSVP